MLPSQYDLSADRSKGSRKQTFGKRCGPAVSQNARVAAEVAMTPTANLPATESARRCTGAVRAWAVSTRRRMSAIVVALPAFSTLTRNLPSMFRVPAVTFAPAYNKICFGGSARLRPGDIQRSRCVKAGSKQFRGSCL